MEYPSDTSSTATIAPPSPDTSQPENVATGACTKQPHHREANASSLDQYAVLGQFSYAPATQTTVVTTTTTTTTSFPPLILKAPRYLHERDPKQYPLAASPTPAQIKRFSLKFNDVPAFYREADDANNGLLEHERTNASLRASNGLLSAVYSSETKYQMPTPASDHQASCETVSSSQISPRQSKKRPASPPSIVEAAEIANLHRRNKRARASICHNPFENQEGNLDVTQSGPARYIKTATPATPETDVGSERKFKQPKSRLRAKRSLVAAEGSQDCPQPICSDGGSQGWDHIGLALTQPLAPGISATPPIAEHDLEPAIPYETIQESGLPSARPTPLDLLSAQDASLPSPSLSPITAAATLHHHHPPPHFAGPPHPQRQIDSLAHSEASATTPNRPRAQAADSLQNRRPHSRGKHLELPKDITSLVSANANPQLPTPTVMDIPTMLDTLDAMPGELQTYVMYHLLRRCAKPTLQFIADVVNPALKIDFLNLLPLELSTNIVRYLDVKSMCRAAQVSKKWRQIIDSDEKAWKDLLDKDGFVLPPGDVDRAIREGWGWQFPYGPEGFEKDLSRLGSRSDTEAPSPLSLSGQVGIDNMLIHPSFPSANRKRKANARLSGGKKRKTRATAPKTEPIDPIGSMEAVQGPIAHANAAALLVPDPNIGLPSLKNLHLYKSIYQRHAAIRKSWMDENTKPHHFAFQAHGSHVVTCLQFDSEKILTGSDDTKINVFDTKTGALRNILDGHEGGVWALQYDGNILVSGSTDRSVRVWDIDTGKCLQVFHGHTSTVRCLVILKPTVIGKNSDGSPIMMPREPLIITGSRDSSLRVWRLPQVGERQIPPTASDHDNPYFIRVLNGHHHSVRAIAAHGDTLVSGSYDSTVRVWKISTGDMVHRLLGHTQKVYSVVLDHQRNRCISGSMDNLVKVWSLETGACLFNLEGHTSLVGLLDLSHDRLVSAAADSTLRIWDPENGQCKSTLSAHTGAITCFQHDAQKVISGSDRTLKMWNVKTGECVRDLMSDLSGVWQVKFNERRCVAAVQRNSWTYIEACHFSDSSRDAANMVN